MALKRKASELEEDNYPTHHSSHSYQPQHDYHHSHQATSSRSSTPSQLSSSSSPSSTDTNFSPDNSADTFGARRIQPIPFQGIRTRKRHRDNRPAQEIIHEQTLKRLFEAQRLHLDDALALPIDDNLSQASTLVDGSLDEMDYTGGVESLDGLRTMDVDMDIDMEIPKEAEPTQRRIDAFFGGRTGETR
jgi:hypothetical protein